MNIIARVLCLFLGGMVISGCSVFGHTGIETAPYSVVLKDQSFEIRHYRSLVLVTTNMPGGMQESQNSAFQNLFDYISGANIGAANVEIASSIRMQNKDDLVGEKIEMTAPVLMQEEKSLQTMSFVLPARYTMETAPKPTNEDVWLETVSDYTVATIQFSGFLTGDNIQCHKQKLQNWIDESVYLITGSAMVAGYNPPWTLPMARRNEVLIPVTKDE